MSKIWPFVEVRCRASGNRVDAAVPPVRTNRQVWPTHFDCSAEIANRIATNNSQREEVFFFRVPYRDCWRFFFFFASSLQRNFTVIVASRYIRIQE